MLQAKFFCCPFENEIQCFRFHKYVLDADCKSTMIIKKPIRIVDKRKDAIPKVSFAAGTIKQLLINTNSIKQNNINPL